MHIKVKPGYVLRDPQTKTMIPAEGLSVPDDSLFYHRRLAEGSVEIVAAQAPATVPPVDAAAVMASLDNAE